MSQDIKGVVNLDYVVKSVLVDLDDNSLRNYKRFLQFAIDGYIDLNLYTMQSVRVAYLTIRDNKTAPLPDDFIDYTKIAIVRDGHTHTLGLNEDLMHTVKTDDCGNPVNDNTEKCSEDGFLFLNYGYHFAPHYRNGQYVGELYSGAGEIYSNGSYRIDRERHQITLSSDVTVDEIILEYKSSGVSGDGSTAIPRQCVKALKNYIHWQRKENNDKLSMGEKERAFKMYTMEFEKLRDLEFSFTIAEYLEMRASTYAQIPKR